MKQYADIGIELDETELEKNTGNPNTGLREIAKLFLNSMWGR